MKASFITHELSYRPYGFDNTGLHARCTCGGWWKFILHGTTNTAPAEHAAHVLQHQYGKPLWEPGHELRVDNQWTNIDLHAYCSCGGWGGLYPPIDFLGTNSSSKRDFTAHVQSTKETTMAKPFNNLTAAALNSHHVGATIRLKTASGATIEDKVTSISHSTYGADTAPSVRVTFANVYPKGATFSLFEPANHFPVNADAPVTVTKPAERAA